MSDDRLEQDNFTDEELEDFMKLFNTTLKNVCIFADKHNFDRDNILKYFSLRLDFFSDICIIENYKWEA